MSDMTGDPMGKKKDKQRERDDDKRRKDRDTAIVQITTNSVGN